MPCSTTSKNARLWEICSPASLPASSGFKQPSSASQRRKAHQKKRSRLQQSRRPRLRRCRYRRRPGDTALFPVPPRRHLRGQVAFFRVHARQAAPWARRRGRGYISVPRPLSEQPCPASCGLTRAAVPTGWHRMARY